ncbi:MAG TPA: SdrD B-like domain-containing protein [Tepidisphaeraceae bacterium]|nr:SdrD B-like domain-containing protein [Tepidisphaeraceae bacterium]
MSWSTLKAKLRAAVLESLESRTLMSATPLVMGYLVDYKIGGGNTGFAENGSGAITTDNLNWKALKQVNYFSLEPDVSPAYPGGSTTSQGTSSDGHLQAATSSGYNPAVQLPNLVADANKHGVKTFVTIGGGDPGSIYDVDALVNSPSAYGTFAASLKSFCNTYGVSGVDLDWEPTAQGGFTVTSTQIENFGNLVKTIKADDPSLSLSADSLGDPVELSTAAGADTGKAAYELNSVAVQYLDTINVEAYPVTSESESDTIMNNWKAYVSGGKDLDGKTVSTPVSKLQYGLDVDDDTSNQPAKVIENKVDLTFKQGFGGLFIFEADASYANTALSRLGAEISKDSSTSTDGSGNTVSGSIKTSSGTGVAGITVYLDSNYNHKIDSSEPSTTTDASGNYSFSKMPNGAYVIRQILPSGDTQTSPASNAGIYVDGTGSSSFTNENFIDAVPATGKGNTASGSIKTAGAAGVAGVTVYLDSNYNHKIDGSELSTKTDASGNYSFSNIPSGAFVIRQILPSGDTQTSPSSNAGIYIDATGNSTFTNENFIDAVPAKSNANTASGSIKTKSGTGIAGVKVYLDINYNHKIDSNELFTTTNSSGNYSFSDIPDGAYVIRQILPSGVSQIAPTSNAGLYIDATGNSVFSNESFVDS